MVRWFTEKSWCPWLRKTGTAQIKGGAPRRATTAISNQNLVPLDAQQTCATRDTISLSDMVEAGGVELPERIIADWSYGVDGKEAPCYQLNSSNRS